MERRRAPRTILLVDDNETFSQMIVDVLPAYWKFRSLPKVVVAASIEGAVDALHERDVDMILLDLSLPGLNGIETVSTLLSAIGAEKAFMYPIVVLSAYVDDKMGLEALGLGVQEYVNKPGRDLLPRLVHAINLAWTRHCHLHDQFETLRRCANCRDVAQSGCGERGNG